MQAIGGDGDLEFWTDGLQRIIIPRIGGLYINPRNPGEELYVSENTGSGDTEIIIDYSGSAGGAARSYSLSTSSAGFGIRDKVSGGEPRIFVNPAGNVGIGTENPQVELHVASVDATHIRLENIGNAIMQMSATNNGIIGTQNNAPLLIQSNNATRMTVHENGNVGIGTGNPQVALDVAGAIKHGNQNQSGGCNAQRRGSTRFNAAENRMEFCSNNNTWRQMGGSQLVVNHRTASQNSGSEWMNSPSCVAGETLVSCSGHRTWSSPSNNQCRCWIPSNQGFRTCTANCAKIQ